MKRKIKIIVGKIEVKAELHPTKVAELIWDLLPIQAVFNLWGDEIYFPISVIKKDIDNPVDTVQAGDLAYWPEGHCFCIFFGPTPISSPGHIKPAGPVEIFGSLLGDPLEFKRVQGEEKIRVERGL